MQRENLFMINIHSDDEQIDRKELILRRENPIIKADREALNEKLGKAIMKNAFGPAGVMMILSTLFLMGGLCFGLLTVVDYLREKSISPIVLGVAVVSLALGGIFALIRKNIDKKNEENSPLDALDESYARIAELSRRDLGVPSDAKRIELFAHFYDESDAPDEAYDIDEVEAFVEDGKLCLYHIDVVIAIPLDSIEGIVKCGDTVRFKDQTRDSLDDSEEYSKYGIEKKQIDGYNAEYSMKGYYSLRFSLDGTPMEIAIPLYEIEPLLDLIGLEVVEE